VIPALIRSVACSNGHFKGYWQQLSSSMSCWRGSLARVLGLQDLTQVRWTIFSISAARSPMTTHGSTFRLKPNVIERLTSERVTCADPWESGTPSPTP
jgi:hypothetical protein